MIILSWSDEHFMYARWYDELSAKGLLDFCDGNEHLVEQSRPE